MQRCGMAPLRVSLVPQKWYIQDKLTVAVWRWRLVVRVPTMHPRPFQIPATLATGLTLSRS